MIMHKEFEELGWKPGLIKVGNKELDAYSLGEYIITSYNNEVLDISYYTGKLKTVGLSRVFRGKIKTKEELEVLMKQII